MKKEEKLVAWMQIKSSGKAPPSFDRWTDADEEKLLEAQSDIVEMAHTAIGHLEEMKKRELALAAMTMNQEDFDRLVEQRTALVAEESSTPAALTVVTAGNDTLAAASRDW